MKRTCSRLVDLAIIVGVMVVPSVLLFGPMGGFHHHYGFGLLRYMILNGEDPDPRYPSLFGCEIWFSPVMFTVTLVIWIIVLLLVVFGVRAFRGTT